MSKQDEMEVVAKIHFSITDPLGDPVVLSTSKIGLVMGRINE